MSRFVLRGFPLLGLAALMMACVTVNIYFPATKVEKAAEEIVGEVYGQEGEQTAPDKKKTGPSSWLGGFLAWLGPRAALAAEETTVSNAAIRGLKAQIAQHHHQLRPYYNQGTVGIDKDGFAVIRQTEGLPVAKLAALKRIVAADKKARQQLYKEVA
ncbi:MAG: hypothetical protein JRJ59_11085, partial [Deltaproteobacteria bacterium]|nr:hypothetical protein [Deltaproteobacteria bacterium]